MKLIGSQNSIFDPLVVKVNKDMLVHFYVPILTTTHNGGFKAELHRKIMNEENVKKFTIVPFHKIEEFDFLSNILMNLFGLLVLISY